MTITSKGYAGEINAPTWARLMPFAGADYAVRSEGAWKVTPVTSGADRTVSVAPGELWGKGILDDLDVPTTYQLPTIASGQRWDLVVARRTWSGGTGTTTIEHITATTAGNIPNTREDTPGTLDEQPLALVRVVYSSGATVIAEVIDLRVWQANGGAVAVSDKVLQYLTAPGTEVTIAGITWKRVLSTAGVASWDKQTARVRLGAVESPITGSPVTATMLETLGAFIITGAPQLTVSTSSDVKITFPNGGFPTALIGIFAQAAASDGVTPASATGPVEIDAFLWPPGLTAAPQSKTEAYYRLKTRAGASMAGSQVRMSYIAIGY